MKMPLTRAQRAALERAEAEALARAAAMPQAPQAPVQQPMFFSAPGVPPPNDNFNFDFLMMADKRATLSGFNHFSNLGEYQHEIKIIGQPSENGFIRKLKYQAGYDAVLKSSQQDDTDSLVYEYLVGQCINYFSQFYPCFSYTYAACQYKNETMWGIMRNAPKGTSLRESLANFVDLLDTTNIDALINNGCTNNKLTCLLTQFIPVVGDLIDNVKSFAPLTDPTFDQRIVAANRKELFDECIRLNLSVTHKTRKDDLIEKLTNYYSVYVFPATHATNLNIYTLFFHMTYVILNSFRHMLTHYDLHTGNVMVVNVPEGKVVTIFYYSGGKQIMSYNTGILPVIIDYGRCFVNCAATSSFEVLKKVCNQDGSNPKKKGPCVDSCGNNRGYGFSSPYNSSTGRFDETDEGSYYINYTKKNNSHDLRFLKHFSSQINFSQVAHHPLVQLFRRIVPSVTEFGFPETASIPDGYIRNVEDAVNQLSAILLTPGFTTGYEGVAVYGELHIHTDLIAPFSFVKK